MKTHELKILPQYFKNVASGLKTYEVRVNDRDFKIGDIVILNEWCPEILFSERYLVFKIGYILDLGDERVVFSLLKHTKT